MRSFAELERDDQVTAAEVAEVLEHYAASSARITSSVVVGLIGRTNPCLEEREHMKVSAQKGKDKQTHQCITHGAAAYEQVIHFLNQ